MMNGFYTRASRYLIPWLLVLYAAEGGSAKPVSDTHAKVSILAEESALVPGRTTWIGLLFDLEKEWHIYWVNPGDSGAALRVRWSLPNGFKAGEIHWPAPNRVGKGEVTDYGYEGRVLLPLQLQVPASYRAGAPAKIAAAVHYMICRKLVCMAAEAQPTVSVLTASVASARDSAPASSASRNLFQEARESEPKPMPSAWKTRAFDDGQHFVLTLESGSPIGKASFFPLVSNQLDNAAPQTITPTARGVQITLKKSVQLALAPRPIPILKGVIVLGPHQGYEIAAPLAAP